MFITCKDVPVMIVPVWGSACPVKFADRWLWPVRFKNKSTVGPVDYQTVPGCKVIFFKICKIVRSISRKIRIKRVQIWPTSSDSMNIVFCMPTVMQNREIPQKGNFPPKIYCKTVKNNLIVEIKNMSGANKPYNHVTKF